MDIELGANQPSGIEAFNWLKDKGFAGSIYFLTGHGRSHNLVAKAFELGQCEVLTKPISAAALLHYI